MNEFLLWTADFVESLPQRPLWFQAAAVVAALVALAPIVWALATLLFVLPLIRRSLRQHLFSSCITVVSTALASGLVMSVFAIQQQTMEAFTGGPAGFHAVLGARGSQLQLVMNAVFHLETSPGNIPWSLYQEVRRRPYVDLAIPYALGDNFFGFRIVGTTEELFTRFEYAAGPRVEESPGVWRRGPGRKFELRPGGRRFDPTRMEAVVGSFAAQKTGLRVGSKFNPYHGLDFDPTAIHAEEYVVVGILEPTNTPADRVIWIPIEGVYRIAGHALRGAGVEYIPRPTEEIPDEHKEVSAVMLTFKGGEDGAAQFGLRLSDEVNRRGKVATLAFPIGASIAEMFEKIGWVNRVLELVAYLVVLVAAGAILASIYNTMNERRREFAILRALGARRSTVFFAIVLEAASISCLGALLGYVVYGAIFIGATLAIKSHVGVVLDWTLFHPIMVAAPIGMVLIGGIAGIIPAVKAYSTDVATNLAPMS